MVYIFSITYLYSRSSKQSNLPSKKNELNSRKINEKQSTINEVFSLSYFQSSVWNVC